MLLRELLPNLAIVAITTSMWTLNRRYAVRAGHCWSAVIFSLIMAGGVLGTMSMPLAFSPGILLDLHYCPLGVAAYFGGPLGAILPLATAVARRISLGGEACGPGFPKSLRQS